MKIIDLNKSDLIKKTDLNSNWLSTISENLNINCKIYKGDFCLDSLNYFPITSDNYTFSDLFSWKEKNAYQHYYDENFALKLKKEKSKFKSYSDLTILGSSPGNNYYRNLITFFPRIFFISNKNVNIGIHRKTSNKFREFIKYFLNIRGINLKKFIYLDDEFYYFKNSEIPQFFPLEANIKILRNLVAKNKTKNAKNKIYLTRKNSYYRKIINESDLIDELKSKSFKIVDLETLSINEQINIFAEANTIISATSSSLSNCVFCQNGTKIIEIMPQYKFPYENIFKNRYANICKILSCNYSSIEAEPVQVEKIDEETKKFIHQNILKESNYYKNLIVKKDKFKNIINKI